MTPFLLVFNHSASITGDDQTEADDTVMGTFNTHFPGIDVTVNERHHLHTAPCYNGCHRSCPCDEAALQNNSIMQESAHDEQQDRPPGTDDEMAISNGFTLQEPPSCQTSEGNVRQA